MNYLENITVKMELGVPASRLISQYQLNNGKIEEAVVAGMQRALNEIGDEETFTYFICEETKKHIKEMVKNAVNGWELRRKLNDAVTNAVNTRIEQIAANWADELLKNLNQ